MERKWAVRPDQEDGTLSREALIGAFVDASTVLDIAGGCLEVVVGRAPTGVPGEMVMTGAMLCWKDRTDAKPQREATVELVPEDFQQQVINTRTGEEVKVTVVPETDFDAAEETAHLRTHTEAGPIQTGEPDPNLDPDDGFDYGKMPDEDVEDAPVPAR